MKWSPDSAPLVIPSVPPLRSISQGVIASSELSQSRRSPLCARRPPAFGPLSYLLIENYDNRAGVVEIRQRNPEAKIAIFHGTKDEVIPVRMGRELAQNFPFIDFFPVEGANHVSVLSEAHDKIIRWMNN